MSLADFDFLAKHYRNEGLTDRLEMFEQQWRFFNDPSQLKAACCSRRAGKTQAAAAWLGAGAEQDGTTMGMSLWIALRRSNARNVGWRALKMMCPEFRLQEQDGQLMAFHPNGHQIWFAGCNTAAEVEKFEGFKFRRVVIDEGQTYGGYLKQLIESSLEPTLLDCGGEMALLGRPGILPAGYFYEATKGLEQRSQVQCGAWSVHHWTMTDNPYIEAVPEKLEDLKQRHGWTEEHPTFMREYRGLWVRDDDAQVYPFDSGRNYYDSLPEAHWYNVLSVDIGWDDATAFVLSCSRPRFPEVYVPYAHKTQAVTVPRIAGEIEALRHRFRISKIVVDTAGGSKVIAETLKAQGIPCEPARKTDKLTRIHSVRGRLMAGTLLVQRSEARELVEEWQYLPWNEARTDHHENFGDDLSDALAQSEGEHTTLYRPEEEPPEEGSPEWYDRERKRMRAEAQARVRKRQGKSRVNIRRIARE